MINLFSFEKLFWQIRDKPRCIYVLFTRGLPKEIVRIFSQFSLEFGWKIVIPEIGHPEKDIYLREVS